MKPILAFLLCISPLFFSSARCGIQREPTATGKNIDSNINSTASKMKIRIGYSSFTATLYDNATAAAFKSMLPLTVDMVELNGNEKYVDLSRKLPTDASNPGTIKNGDLMLYGSSTLVLFYKTFSTLAADAYFIVMRRKFSNIALFRNILRRFNPLLPERILTETLA